MTSKKKQKGISPALESAINKMLKTVMEDEAAKPLDRLRVIDRALNLEKIKQKISDEEWGSGFDLPDEEPET